MEKDKHSVRIHENYKDYSPPVQARRAIERMLDNVPQVHLIGLKDIVLTNAEAMNHSRRREKTWSRKRKVGLKQSGGVYHHKWKGEPAWIEIFLDNIFTDVPRLVAKIPFVRDILLSEVLYHELGHHIHKTQVKEYREREDVADDWQGKLSKGFFWKKYWHWLIVFYPFVALFNLGNLIRKKFLKYSQKMRA